MLTCIQEVRAARANTSVQPQHGPFCLYEPQRSCEACTRTAVLLRCGTRKRSAKSRRKHLACASQGQRKSTGFGKTAKWHVCDSAALLSFLAEALVLANTAVARNLEKRTPNVGLPRGLCSGCGRRRDILKRATNMPELKNDALLRLALGGRGGVKGQTTNLGTVVNMAGASHGG